MRIAICFGIAIFWLLSFSPIIQASASNKGECWIQAKKNSTEYQLFIGNKLIYEGYFEYCIERAEKLKDAGLCY